MLAIGILSDFYIDPGVCVGWNMGPLEYVLIFIKFLKHVPIGSLLITQWNDNIIMEIRNSWLTILNMV